ncbi:ATP/GTP-binding protein [Streptomyces sp. WAC 01529]|uniref:ATP/GTP-binding protein n=1 Tax=Streptomyces sp. WAC 01529 TaxID=2203205 RepID=UPI000F6E8365|nr:ATP/GTP-binding protein [Streptomyces sp. WAC 01529]AZM54549.1 ATP/GTP-binding protein [Streptomyces sp. WAC 01529]
MAGRDLRALFSTNDRTLGTAEAFTNRQAQWAFAMAALTEHLRQVDNPAFDAADLEAPRNNVVVFHGIGGIGKSTLSRKLEASLTDPVQRPAQWAAPAWGQARILPVRIDLARAASPDFEKVVLSVRLALAAVGRPLPAFDVALRRYWEHQHPGSPLEDFLNRSGLGTRFGKALPQQMQSVLADIAQMLMLPGTVGSAIGQVTGALVGALRERRQTVGALADCARLVDLLESEPDLDSLSYYPHLLGFELARLPAGKRVTPVILLDSFEEVGDRTHRDFERLLQRLVWLMPNAFFVITGRSRLQWADEALQGQLDFTGPAAWPGLAAHDIRQAGPEFPALGRERQMLIGDFSLEDCDDYLGRRLSADGRPLISDAIRTVIAQRSHGLPLYLDLSVMRFLELRRSGRTPQPADFDHDFPALIARTLSDLTAPERHVLRSVSLFSSFDITLATRAAGLPQQAPALRLTERPFVRETPFGLWPYHLHALIRTTIRDADDQTDDRWSPADWQQAVTRSLAALGEQWRDGSDRDRLLLVGCLRQGLAIARNYRLDLGWLIDAAWTYVGDSVWEPLDVADSPEAAGAAATAADALVDLLSAIARRQHENRARTVERLVAVANTGLLPAELSEMAVYYRAKAQRDLGDTEGSRQGMQLVAAGGGRLAPNARRGLAHLARLAGDFPTALEAAAHLGWAGRHHRVVGDVQWVQGDMPLAAQAFGAAVAEAEEHGKNGEAAMSQAMRAFTLAFTTDPATDDEIDLGEHLLAQVDLRAATLDIRIAAFLRDAGTDTGVEDRAQVLAAEISTSGLRFVQAKLELARAFHHAIRDDQAGVASSISRLRELTREGYYAYYVDIVHFMADLPLDSPSRARWLDEPQTVHQRWRSMVIDRRAQLTPGPATGAP